MNRIATHRASPRRTSAFSPLNDLLFAAVVTVAAIGAGFTAAAIGTDDSVLAFASSPSPVAMGALPTVVVVGHRVASDPPVLAALPRVVVVGHRLAPVVVETAHAAQAGRLQADEI